MKANGMVRSVAARACAKIDLFGSLGGVWPQGIARTAMVSSRNAVKHTAKISRYCALSRAPEIEGLETGVARSPFDNSSPTPAGADGRKAKIAVMRLLLQLKRSAFGYARR